jgi:hypothetical protein
MYVRSTYNAVLLLFLLEGEAITACLITLLYYVASSRNQLQSLRLHIIVIPVLYLLLVPVLLVAHAVCTFPFLFGSAFSVKEEIISLMTSWTVN